MKKIGVIGLWHLGCVMSACLADLGYHIVAYDKDKCRIDKLNQGFAPLFEPGLNELIKEHLGENLIFTNSVSALKDVDYLWITVDTKLDENDKCDIDEIQGYVLELNNLEHCNSFIFSSQMPVGSCDKLKELISSPNCRVACVPENFQLGKSIEYFKNTDFWVIGSDDEEFACQVKEILQNEHCDPIISSLRTAEFFKHALNSFLACVISYTNSLSELASGFGANAYKIAEMLKREPRIKNGRIPLIPGSWFSGGTLARDVTILSTLKNGGNTYAEKFFDSILKVNQSRCDFYLDKMFSHFNKKKIAECSVSILGVIYKSGTNTMRRSPGLQVINSLTKRDVKKINIYDNLLDYKLEIQEKYSFKQCDSIADAVMDADCVIIVRSDIVSILNEDDILNLFSGKVVLDIPNALNYDNDVLTIIKPGK